MKIYKAAIIGLGPSGLAVNKLIYSNKEDEVIAFEHTDFEIRNNFFGFWLTDWMKPFEKLIDKSWDSWSIGNSDTEIIHKDNKHPYCVISFKTWMNFCLDTINKLNIVRSKVTRYFKVGNYFKIITDDDNEYFAERIYDSRSNEYMQNELIQHFYGISITTKNKAFDQNKLTLMHFTQESLLHFIYVLPFSQNNALVESTVFSKEVLSDHWYRERISSYLNKLNIYDFKENFFEKGVIPMFFNEQKPSKDQKIYNIGIRGGACKPSTGYAFSFLIKQIQILKNSKKNYVHVHSFLEKKMDKIFLNYLKFNSEKGESFLSLAKNLKGKEFQSFMMGRSSFLTKIKIIKSMPKLPFIKAIIN